MKGVLFCLLMMCFVFAKGQDTIIMKTGEKILGKITNIKGGLVFFENHNENSYSSSSIHEQDVSQIILGNNQSITKPSKKVLKGHDYCAPWHNKTNDTLNGYVSEIGVYVSASGGGGSTYGIGGVSALLSASLAYKSHLFTITRAGASVPGEIEGNSTYYYSNYFGALIGESIRFKHLMLSFSAGIASSSVAVYKFSGMAYHPTTYNIDGVSFPIEIKAFIYAHNGIGIGIHSSKCLVSPSQFSPFSFGISIVGGYWNKPKNIK